MNGTILEFPNLLTHSQDVERAVKLRAESSQTVNEQEARHNHIITKSLCHQIRSSFTSKVNYTEQFSYIIM